MGIRNFLIYIKGLAVGLALKQRIGATRKWPNMGKIDQCITLQVPRVTNINFLLTILILTQEKSYEN